MARKKQGKPSDYYPGGKKKPVLHGPTPELLRQKRAETCSDQYEMTPLGILAGRKLISADQYEFACNFRIQHDLVWNELGQPRTPAGTLSRSKSAPGHDDAQHAIDAQRLRSTRDQRVERAAVRHRDLEDALGTHHWGVLMWLAVYSERSGWLHFGGLYHQIKSMHLHWDELQKRVVADRPGACILPTTLSDVMLLRTVLQKASGRQPEDLRPEQVVEEKPHRIPQRRDAGVSRPSRRHSGESYAQFNQAAYESSAGIG